MLQRLRVQNFRSLREATIDFSSTGLTILIGPNGSGKSNVVKALEFLSSISVQGLQVAVGRQGGRASMVPKGLPSREHLSAKTSLQIDVQMPNPSHYPKGFGPPSASYSIALAWDSKNNFHVTAERTTFGNPIALSLALGYHDADDDDVEETQGHDRTVPADVPEGLSDPSEFRIFRGKEGRARIEAFPKFTKQNIQYYLRWLGFHGLAASIRTREEIESFIQAMTPRPEEGERDSRAIMSIYDPEYPVPIGAAPQAVTFRVWLQNMRRFDLQLVELRRDQLADAGKRFRPTGSNMPAMVRSLSDNTDADSWEAIMATMSEVAPHVLGVSVAPLRGGREFVEFLETKVGKRVESWNASDGTLRALAILVALETQPKHSLLLIEEPELGVHPWAVKSLMRHVRDVIARRNLQVVFTTHSQQVLEAATPDEVLVVSRGPDKGTTVTPVTKAVPSAKIAPTELGALWVKGLLGGVPDYDA